MHPFFIPDTNQSTFYMIQKILRIAGFVLLLVAGGCCLNSVLHIDNYPGKIWLHRCNSVEKYREKHPRYPNVEIDLVFRDNQRFDVTHDIDTTFGLTLDSILAESLRRGGGNFWLDIKNLDATNSRQVLSEMERLCTTYNVSPKQFILESPDWRSLSLFTRRGYYTSCYVPYDKPSDLERSEVKNCIMELRKVADSHAVRALSFPGWWYPVLKKYLHRPIDLLTWKHRTTQFEFFLTPIGWKMLNDPQLKVILIKDKGKFHR